MYRKQQCYWALMLIIGQTGKCQNYVTYFVIRLLVFLDGINYFPHHHSIMTHSCITITTVMRNSHCQRKLLKSWHLLRKEDCVDYWLLSSLYFCSQRIQSQNLIRNHSLSIHYGMWTEIPCYAIFWFTVVPVPPQIVINKRCIIGVWLYTGNNRENLRNFGVDLEINAVNMRHRRDLPRPIVNLELHQKGVNSTGIRVYNEPLAHIKRLSIHI